MKQHRIAGGIITIGLLMVIVTMFKLWYQLEWHPVWLIMGVGVGFLGGLLWVWPRRAMPWRWGLWRLLFGEYTCDMYLCDVHEGWGGKCDLRTNHMRMANISNLSDKQLVIGNQVYDIIRNVPVEIRRCGFPHPQDLGISYNELIITQTDDVISVRFVGKNAPPVSPQLAYRVLNQVLKAKVPETVLYRYVRLAT